MSNFSLQSLSPSNPLLILDMANNHNGSVAHGQRIVDELSSVEGIRDFPVAIKFQYRNLPDFIQESFRERRDLKYVDRFLSTMLSWEDFLKLKNYIQENGFLTACTPFDEASVHKVIEHNFDILKIASASFTDWSLLEESAHWTGPIIASTAGASIIDLDRVTTMFKNRQMDFALMHCVAAYPTLDEDLMLNRISALRERYGSIPIGYSTHENPNNLLAGPMALAAGARILERHVGSPTPDSSLNGYSSDDKILSEWIRSLKSATSMLGHEDVWQVTNSDEQNALKGLRRFLFASRTIKKGEVLISKDFYFGIPGSDNQLQSKDAGKYDLLVASCDIEADEALTFDKIDRSEREARVFSIRDRIIELVRASGVTVPNNSVLEISHHFGLDNFERVGSCMITVVNRGYCKKLIFMLPGQTHPAMYHKKKDETFFLLYGDLDLRLDHQSVPFAEGDTISISPGVVHEFSSHNGAILEEVSSSHFVDDSFYLDESITNNHNRKTFVQYWI